MQDLPQGCEAPYKKNQGVAGLRQLPENDLGEYQMNCMTCHLDKKKHSEELWKLHQQSKLCMFCNKSGSEHSEELWELHKAAVENGQYCTDHKKKEKLYPITFEFGRNGIARVCRTNAEPPYDVEFIPINMSCTECGLYLGSIEEDYADLLDCMCLKCFREAIGQPGDWCDVISTNSAKMDHIDIDRSTLRSSKKQRKQK